MALRALLFSSDGSATAELCQVLTDLGIEAEICTEMLVAVERVSREKYDAILVDWEQETEATFLLKTAREQKTSQALNLALVRDDKEVGRALQQGANSVIKKPVDALEALDTLSTAHDLILSRRTEQKDKEARLANAQAELSAAAAEDRDQELPAPKTGFLAQTAPRSAFEAQTQAVAEEASEDEQPHWQAARGAEALREDQTQVQEIRPPEKNSWSEPKPPAKEYEAPEEETSIAPVQSDDATRIFSSLAEEEQAQAEPRPRPHSQRLGFVLIACMLIAGVLYVWAPGDSYGGRLTSLFHVFSSAPGSGTARAVQGTTPPVDSSEKPSTPQPPAKADDTFADSGPVATTEVDPSKIQIIEAKAIPKAGAQLPPSTDPPPDADQAQAQSDATAANGPSPADPGSQGASSAQRPQASSPKLTPSRVAVVPISQSRPTVPLPTADTPSTVEAGNGVIIPDSLKTTPSQTPASSLDTSAVPEEISRELVVQRVEPDYPAQALQQHFEGSVVLQVWVNKDGTIRELKLVKGYFVLGRAAFEAVKQWRFKPYSPNGKPIDFQTYVTVNFKYPG